MASAACASGCVEDELDHLPVALVRVVEVVERVEEPVLERELPGDRLFADDVRVDDGLAALRQALSPAVVVAAGSERVAREVEVVLEARHEVVRADGAISTRSVTFQGPRSATVSSPSRRSMSVGTNGSP